MLELWVSFQSKDSLPHVVLHNQKEQPAVCRGSFESSAAVIDIEAIREAAMIPFVGPHIDVMAGDGKPGSCLIPSLHRRFKRIAKPQAAA